MKHTPGPWMWDGDELWTRGHCGRPCYYMGFEMSITVDEGFEHSEELAATKLVIAAAPDLLEALELLLDSYGEAHARYDLGDCEGSIRARAAIKKAKGEE